jgi:hypothetical protein
MFDIGLRGPAITEIDLPHLLMLSHSLASSPLALVDLIEWESGGNGPGNFLGKWESDRVFPAPHRVELEALQRDRTWDFRTQLHLPARTNGLSARDHRRRTCQFLHVGV